MILVKDLLSSIWQVVLEYPLGTLVLVFAFIIMLFVAYAIIVDFDKYNH